MSPHTDAFVCDVRSPPYFRLKGNTVYDNADAGLALIESFRADVHDNTFKDNNYGISLSVGCANNAFENNDIIDSSE